MSKIAILPYPTPIRAKKFRVFPLEQIRDVEVRREKKG